MIFVKIYDYREIWWRLWPRGNAKLGKLELEKRKQGYLWSCCLKNTYRVSWKEVHLLEVMFWKNYYLLNLNKVHLTFCYKMNISEKCEDMLCSISFEQIIQI